MLRLRKVAWAGLIAFCLPLSAAGVRDDVAATVFRADLASIIEVAPRQGTFVVPRVPVAPGRTADLVLERFEVTTAATRFVLGPGDRPIPGFDPRSIVLLRGSVAGAPGSHVFLVVTPRGAFGSVDFNDGTPRRAISSRGSDLQPGELAIFDSPPGIGPLLGVPACGVEELPGPPAALQGQPSPVSSAVSLDLAIDTDYEYFQIFGDSTDAAAYVTALYGAVGDIYLRDLDVRVKLGFVRIWDAEEDLYNEESPLDAFVNEWEENMGGVERDAAQLLTGRRNLPYGGVAYVEAACQFGYSVAGYAIGSFPTLDAPSSGTWDVIVTSHELGHNCGTFHTHDYGIDECAFGVPQRGEIMSYCHTTPGGNANIDLRFTTFIQGVIQAYLSTVSCLDDDCNGNGTDDAEDISAGASDDDNGNGVLDPADIAAGFDDDNGNGIPDVCEPDCNGNGVPDDLDIALATSDDLYLNGIPDECEADCDGDSVSDYNELQADLGLDVDRNAVLDACQDCDGDDVSDFDALAGAHNLWIASQSQGVLTEAHASSGAAVRSSIGGNLFAPADLVVRADRHVLVSTADGRVAEFDPEGAFLDDLVAAGSGGLTQAGGMLLRDDATLLVANVAGDSILEYDAQTGAFLGAFVAPAAGGLNGPFGLALGPDGDLYVTCSDNRVRRYDGATGAFIEIFVSPPGNGGLSSPIGLLFKPDGNLLVASYLTDSILEYDGQTGDFLGRWDHGGLSSGFWGLVGPWDLCLGPDGNVYVTSQVGNAAVHLYETATGKFMRSFYVLAAAGPLDTPSGLHFIPGDATDCNQNHLPDSCDITAGTSTDSNRNGTPDECESILGDLDNDGLVGVTDLLILLSAWGPCPNPCPPTCQPDLNADCAVNVTDLLALLATWTI